MRRLICLAVVVAGCGPADPAAGRLKAGQIVQVVAGVEPTSAEEIDDESPLIDTQGAKRLVRVGSKVEVVSDGRAALERHAPGGAYDGRFVMVKVIGGQDAGVVGELSRDRVRPLE